jgi:hypothetical protein
MTQIREQLRDLDGDPQRAIDPSALITAGRRRRLRRHILSAVVVMTLIAGTTAGTIALASTSTSQSHIQAGDTPTSTTVQQNGLSLALPAPWRQLPLMADGVQLLAVGTTNQSSDAIRACGPSPTPGNAAFITISPYYAPSGQPPTVGQGTIGPRPPAFTLDNSNLAQDCPASGQPITSSPPTTGATGPAASSGSTPGRPSTSTTSTVPATSPTTSVSNHARDYAFADAGRYVLAQINVVGDPTGQLLPEAVAVLNTLQVSAAPTPTLTVAPPTTTTLPRATDPGPADKTAARQAILSAMTSAFGNQGPVPLQDSVQGGFPLDTASQQAGHNANPGLVGTIVVRINWLVFLDATHAELNFDLLVNDQPVTANTTGTAVVENGQWKLGRNTYCQIIARGGTISCPSP